MKDQYFEIVQELKAWLIGKLDGYEYDKSALQDKIDDPHYKLAVREKK